jgi:hypothetical protein
MNRSNSSSVSQLFWPMSFPYAWRRTFELDTRREVAVTRAVAIDDLRLIRHVAESTPATWSERAARIDTPSGRLGRPRDRIVCLSSMRRGVVQRCRGSLTRRSDSTFG